MAEHSAVPVSQAYPVELLIEHARNAPQRRWLVQPADGRTRCWTWAQALEEVARMAAALRAQDWPPGSCIAIAGRNTAHWFLADLAIQWAGHVPVGLYPKQAARTTTYILEHCEARALFLGPMSDADEFLRAVPPGVRTIGLPYAEAPRAKRDWDALVAAHAPLREYTRPAPDALMTLIYTSGTTGHPKGVMMSYGSIAWVAQAFLDKLPPAGDDERLFSYLPLAHLMERAAVEIASLLWRAEVHFLEAIDQLAQQLPRVAPTRFFAVPLVWARFQAGVLRQIPEPRLRRLMAVPLLRAVLRRRLRKALGLQRVRMAVSGAAPIPQATLEWFRQMLGIEILEGYGMTENGAYVSANLPGQVRAGAVGRPFADAGFRLAEDGEIQCRHPGVMAGYYKDPAQTAAAFTADGWLRTGDKGRIDADGYLSITGRVKDIFKTAKGKYVAPAPIECALARNADIDQLCVVGMNLTQPVAVVTLTPAAQARPRAEIERGLHAAMHAVNAALEEHEKIARLLIAPETWTIDNGFMTPTMKVKRDVVEARYQADIEFSSRDRAAASVWITAVRED